MRDAGGVVAILFTDLVGSTELLDRLGDDAAEQLRRTHFSLLRQAAAETDGAEVKSLGDGLHGAAVVVAKRLCDQADGGQILASDLITALVGKRGEFQFRSMGRLKLKGLSEPTAAVTVEWREPGPGRDAIEPRGRRAPPRPDPPRPPGRPLVGRQAELERLGAALDEAGTGRGRMVFVVGEMGIGKTRLVEEGLALARDQGLAVLVGRTPAAGSGLAYAPLLSAFGAPLRSLGRLERDDLVGDLPHLGRLWPEFGLPPPAPV